MRTIMVLFLAGAFAGAQSPELSRSDQRKATCSSPNVLYRPVVLAMWSHDEGEEHPYAEANGFIRIAAHPAWSQEFFADVHLNRKGPATVALYSLPKGTKTITTLLERGLKQHPNADAESLAKMLPIRRQTLQADKKIESLIAEFFDLRWEPRRIPNSVRLDATEYELMYVGEDTLTFDSNDYETPIVKWIESFLAAVHDASGT